MADSAWELRTNFKDKPGSQGTLFQVADKNRVLNPQQRWPRGYSPERQAEVIGALKDAYGRDTAFQGDGEHHVKAQKARVVDTVSRSTVPAEHLNGLGTVTAQPDSGTHGTYWPRTATLAVNMHTRNDRDSAGKTLIHELGHHHVASDREHNLSVGQKIEEIGALDKHLESFKTSSGEINTTGRIMARQAVEPGVHEAAADTYMTDHYRTRGRNPKPVTRGAYEENFTSDKIDRAYPGYTDVRPAPLQRQQFAETRPLEGMGAQWSLDERDRAREARP